MRSAIDILAGLAEAEHARLSEYNRRGKVVHSRSYSELLQRAQRIAHSMRAAGVAPGDAVFVQLPNGCELVEQMFGAMIAGALPCCLAPPRALGGLAAFRDRLARLFGAFPGCHLIAAEDTGSRSGQAYREPFAADDTAGEIDLPTAVAADAIAFLQLTSGTSRAPKAVKISHGALAANVRGIVRGGRMVASDSFVSWLPLYHDMGLVGMLFCALAGKASLDLFRPDTFAARPKAWLDAIARQPGTVISTAPNFAYRHCVEQISAAEVATLDLSRWRVAGCGAERVRPETLKTFFRHFEPAGFRPEAFVPCYGMAEATLAVAFDRHGRPPRVVDGQVSCGQPLEDTEVVIRDADGKPVPEGSAGEITVRGPGLCSGYTADEAEDPIRDGWLHTGDQGRLIDGELFVTGRLKDLIIIDGQNFDPTEIEALAQDEIRTRGGRVAAFPTEVDGRERVVLAVELARRDTAAGAAAGADLAAALDRLEADVAGTCGFKLHDLILVARGVLPATSSGKVRRAEARRLYETGSLPLLPRP